MKSFSILILFVLLTTTIYAQSNYKQGYIITNNNDSIHGWIDFRTTKINWSTCNFRKTENSKIETFYPGDIKGYRFVNEGKFYVSHDVTINNIERTVFLEYLIKGIIDLYTFEDDDNIVYYFFKDEEERMIPVKKLDDKIIYSEGIGSGKIREDNQYKGILKYIFRNSEEIADKTDNLKFNENNMIKLTKEYHDRVCTTGEKCIVFETKEDKKYTKIQFSAYAGMQMLNEVLIKPPYKRNVSLKNLSGTSFGGLVSFSIPRWMKSISFNLDFSATHHKESYYIKDYIVNKDVKYNFKIWFFDYRLGPRYTYHKGPVRPFIEAYVGGANADSNLEDINWFFTFGVGAGANIMLGENNAIFIRSNYLNRNTKGYDAFNGYSLNIGYTF